MNLLVDTHVLIWILNDSSELKSHHYEMMEDADNTIFFSAASIFEMMTKARIGKLILPPDFSNDILKIYRDFSYVQLAITAEHANVAGKLVSEHKDPWDHMLAAQSIVEDMSVMTVDSRIAEMGARVVW